MSPTSFALALFDPRGRCDRSGLLALAVALLILQIGLGAGLWLADLDLTGPAAMSLKALFFWAAIAAAAKRLHDFGRSAWWLTGALVGVIAWSFAIAFAAVFTMGPEALTPQSPVFAAFFAATALPLFGGLLWLHFAKGMQGPNRYGAVPSGWGFAGPVQARHVLAGDVASAAA